MDLWTRLWGRYHVPQNVFLVINALFYEDKDLCTVVDLRCLSVFYSALAATQFNTDIKSFSSMHRVTTSPCARPERMVLVPQKDHHNVIKRRACLVMYYIIVIFWKIYWEADGTVCLSTCKPTVIRQYWVTGAAAAAVVDDSWHHEYFLSNDHKVIHNSFTIRSTQPCCW